MSELPKTSPFSEITSDQTYYFVSSSSFLCPLPIGLFITRALSVVLRKQISFHKHYHRILQSSFSNIPAADENRCMENGNILSQKQINTATALPSHHPGGQVWRKKDRAKTMKLYTETPEPSWGVPTFCCRLHFLSGMWGQGKNQNRWT